MNLYSNILWKPRFERVALCAFAFAFGLVVVVLLKLFQGIALFYKCTRPATMLRVCSMVLFVIVLTSGCERTAERVEQQFEIDWELLARIDFENPSPNDVPKLVSLFDSHPHRVVWRANAALGKIGDPAIPALVEKLRTEETHRVRARAGLAFGRMGPAGIPALVEVLDDPAYDQTEVIVALARCRPTTEDAVSELIGLLKRDSSKEAALRAISNFAYRPEPEVKAAVPAALEAFIQEEENDRLRRQAIQILSELTSAIEYEYESQKEQEREHLDFLDAVELYLRTRSAR